ncbi:MAG: kelch repeat-containing protein, partial [Polyangiaceae bacterium]
RGRGFLFGGLRFIDFSSGSLPTKVVQGYDFGQNSWTAETMMPQFRDGAAVVIHDGRAFVIGGRTIDESNGMISAPAQLLVYDFQSYQWSSDIAAPMLTPRVGLACAERRGFVYCFGGFDLGGKPLATVDRFELATLQWAPLPDLPSPRYSAQAVALADAVYLLGGKDDADNASASVFRLE